MVSPTPGRSRRSIHWASYYSYDAGGYTKAVIDPLGHRTTSLYDSLRRSLAAIDPLGNRTTLAYDAQVGRLPVHGRSVGHINTVVYDAAGRQVASIDPLLKPDELRL